MSAQRMTQVDSTTLEDDDRPVSPSELDLSTITAASPPPGTAKKAGNPSQNPQLLSPLETDQKDTSSPLHGGKPEPDKGLGVDEINLEESVQGGGSNVDKKDGAGDKDGGGGDDDDDGDDEVEDDDEEESETESDSEDEGMTGGGTFDMASVTYKVVTEKGEETYSLPMACSQGNLPVAVLLWGMYQAKGVDPLTPDDEGNGPIHYAALASSFEVLDFIMQQTGGYDSQKRKLIDARNKDEETALLRAATKGNLNMIKALIRYGSDLGAIDANKNSIVLNAARNGHMWILHFMLSLCPPAVQQTLLGQCDIDNHTPLDWACYKGHTNIAEYLMFRGIEPTHLDNNGRNCLHWAAKNGHSETAAYLVALGMDPSFKDKEGSSAAMFALTNFELYDAIIANPGKRCKYRGGATMGASSQFREGCCGGVVTKDALADLEDGTNVEGSRRGLLSIKVQEALSGLDDGDEKGLNPALMRDNPTRTEYLLTFAILTMAFWAMFVFLQAWISILVLFLSYQMLTGISKNIKHMEKTMSKREGRTIKMGGVIPRLIRAHEAAIGFWFGCALVFFSVCVASLAMRVDVSPGSFTTSDAGTNKWTRSFVLAAEAAQNTPVLFYVITASITIMILSWGLLVYLYRDPGCVYANRNQTYSELLSEVAQGGEPDARKWCRTTLVKKPLRAKFDAPTGLLVARHDHYCIWLDTAVGYSNHRVFMVFVFFQVLSHLLFSIFGWYNIVAFLNASGASSQWCTVVEALVGTRAFGFLALTLCATACFLALSFLLGQQCSNMCNNITTNERMNASRYPWLQDDNGRFLNRFDTGSLAKNLAEFWLKTKDYREVYDMPEIRKGAVGKDRCCNDEGCDEGIALVEKGKGAGGEGGHSHHHDGHKH